MVKMETTSSREGGGSKHLDSDTINGGDGNNTIYGGGGNDSIESGWGGNVLKGESKNDTFQSELLASI